MLMLLLCLLLDACPRVPHLGWREVQNSEVQFHVRGLNHLIVRFLTAVTISSLRQREAGLEVITRRSAALLCEKNTEMNG